MNSALLLGLLLLLNATQTTIENSINEAQETIVIEEEITEIEDTNEITISFVGDCTLGTYKGQSGNTLFTNFYEDNDATYFFENIKEVFEKDDLTFINLEGPLTSVPQTAVKEFPIKGEPEYVDILKEGSIEVCNLANNHTFDCGQKGFEETITILKENDIGYCGEGYIYRTIENNIQIAFLGYKGFNVNNELKETIKHDIELERENGTQLICVMFHYGIERDNYSSSIQEDISRYAIDCGADIVMGGHPHVIQGIEIYKGKTICYSLGNFCFGANKNPKDKDTFIFSQTFILNEKGEIEYKESEIIPCSISSQTNINDYKPTILVGEEKERVLERLKTYSEKYETSYFDK